MPSQPFNPPDYATMFRSLLIGIVLALGVASSGFTQSERRSVGAITFDGAPHTPD
eukprot:gene56915-76002_t